MKALVLAIMAVGFFSVGCTQDTMAKKAEVVVNDTTRAVKKGVNRAEEAACGKLTGDNKVTCLAKLAKNRLEEGVDTATDKASEL